MMSVAQTSKTTLAEFLNARPEELAEWLDLSQEQAARLAREPIYPDDLTTNPFEAGMLCSVLAERYDLVQIGCLIGALQRAAGTTWVRF